MKIIKIFIISLLFLPTFSFASSCLRDGYTVITINGMITTPEGAVYNKKQIAKVVPEIFNKQKVYVDYIYNESHVLGLVDFIDSANQKVMEHFVYPTYDLDKMLSDLSDKVNTQKLLLIAHSQGNFYANDIYNSIASKDGGVPKESIAIYGIGTPTSYIAGGGKYILSSNDEIMNWVRLWGFLDVLPANVTIEGGEEGDDKRGHNLSTIYLKYQGKRIAKEIAESLTRLKENNIQAENEICIAKKDIPFVNKIVEFFYDVVDPISIFIKNRVVDIIDEGLLVSNYKNMGKVVSNLPASVGDIGSEEDRGKEGETAKLDDKDDKDNEKSEQEIIKKEQIEPQNETQTETGALAIELAETLTPEIKTTTRRYVSHSGSNDNQEKEEDDDEEEEEDEEEIIDTIPPVLSLNGPSFISLELGSPYTELGAEAIDVIDGPLSVIISGFIDIAIPGEYTITYTATDLSGNVATTERIIRVSEPSALPDLIIENDAELLSGEYFYDNVIVRNNATLTLLSRPEGLSFYRGVKINANNIIIEEGSRISADYQGYYWGPGSPLQDQINNTGMSYGGRGGGPDSISAYGSSIIPMDLGSGVLNYRGGGAIWLEISGDFINNGKISADGQNHSSGGSIYINTNFLEGAGQITANGGNTDSLNPLAGGGGGRIAVHYQRISHAIEINTEVSGGLYCDDVVCNSAGQDGTAGFFDKVNNRIIVLSSSWRFEKIHSPYEFNCISIRENAEVETEEDVLIKSLILQIAKGSSFTLKGGNELDIGGILVSEDSNFRSLGESQIKTEDIILEYESEMSLSGDEEIETEAIMVLNSSVLKIAPEKNLNIDANGLTLRDGGRITVSQGGLLAGPGTPDFEIAGGLYGGATDDYQNFVYGSAITPLDFGSAGASLAGRGGGTIHLTLDYLGNEGIIEANGGPNASGGSILIETRELFGNGSFSARGGEEYESDGIIYDPGGGGRIAVYYEEFSFAGEFDVSGGCLSSDHSICSPSGTSLVNNTRRGEVTVGGNWQFGEDDNIIEPNKIILSPGTTARAQEGIDIIAPEIILEGGSILTLNEGKIMALDLFVEGGSMINTLDERVLRIETDNLYIDSASSIDANGHGLLSGLGTPDDSNLAGASYGGLGGGESKNTYGSEELPVLFGSGAGENRGGGSIEIKVKYNFLNDGFITALGESGSSGGSVYIETKNINGSGQISVNGGEAIHGSYYGGGGGRIAISYINEFDPSLILESDGGQAENEGQDGTIFVFQREAPYTPMPELHDFGINGLAESIHYFPGETEPISINFIANQDVDWVSVQIKNMVDNQIYKTFHSGSGCVDGTNTCTKVWDGTLSGGNLIAGQYKIIVKMRSWADKTKEYTQELTIFINVEIEEGLAMTIAQVGLFSTCEDQSSLLETGNQIIEEVGEEEMEQPTDDQDDNPNEEENDEQEEMEQLVDEQEENLPEEEEEREDVTDEPGADTEEELRQEIELSEEDFSGDESQSGASISSGAEEIDAPNKEESLEGPNTPENDPIETEEEI